MKWMRDKSFWEFQESLWNSVMLRRVIVNGVQNGRLNGARKGITLNCPTRLWARASRMSFEGHWTSPNLSHKSRSNRLSKIWLCSLGQSISMPTNLMFVTIVLEWVCDNFFVLNPKVWFCRLLVKHLVVVVVKRPETERASFTCQRRLPPNGVRLLTHCKWKHPTCNQLLLKLQGVFFWKFLLSDNIIIVPKRCKNVLTGCTSWHLKILGAEPVKKNTLCESWSEFICLQKGNLETRWPFLISDKPLHQAQWEDVSFYKPFHLTPDQTSSRKFLLLMSVCSMNKIQPNGQSTKKT